MSQSPDGGNSCQSFRSSVKSLSCVRLFAAPWTVAYQAPLSMEFSRQEYWSGLLFLLQGIFPTQGSNLGLQHCRQMLYRLSHQGSPGVRSTERVSNPLGLSNMHHSQGHLILWLGSCRIWFRFCWPYIGSNMLHVGLSFRAFPMLW